MSIIKIIGTRLYQWESGRQLQIIPLPNHTVSCVHFSNPGDSESLVVEPKEANGMLVADIPNILLQNGKNIIVHTVDASADYVETLTDCELHVRRRAKPSNYVYEETEVLSYEIISKRMKALENNLDEQVSDAITDYLEKNQISIPTSGGYYIPEIVQLSSNMVMVYFIPSEEGMEEVIEQPVHLPEGVGISSIETKESTEDSGINTITVKLTNGKTKSFNVRNGGTGNNGITPHIGANGNWFLGERDTRLPSQGLGIKETAVKVYEASENDSAGYVIVTITYTDDTKSEFKLTNGITPDIGKNGNWFFGEKDTGVPASGGSGVDFGTDATLKLENGILSVNTTNDMEQDNTLPITSAGVFATVGNIEALLKTI